MNLEDGCGHYIAFVCEFQHNWYQIDNEDATPIHNIKPDVNNYFGGTNCAMMALYIKQGFDNKYIFNSHNGNGINAQNNNVSWDNNRNHDDIASNTNRIGLNTSVASNNNTTKRSGNSAGLDDSIILIVPIDII
eukprot:49355_1